MANRRDLADIRTRLGRLLFRVRNTRRIVEGRRRQRGRNKRRRKAGTTAGAEQGRPRAD